MGHLTLNTKNLMANALLSDVTTEIANNSEKAQVGLNYTCGQEKPIIAIPSHVEILLLDVKDGEISYHMISLICRI